VNRSREVPTGNRDIENRHISIFVDRRSGKSTWKTPTQDLSHPSEEGHVSRDHPFWRSEALGVGTSTIRISGFPRSKGTGH
jgi:hypothetical protein